MKAADRRPAAQDVMLGHITGYWISQMIFVVAQLGVADVLAKKPLTAAALPQKVGAQPDALHRILRALASVGIFAETADGRFKLTPTAMTLRSDLPGSLRNFERMMVDGYNWRGWQELLHGARRRDPLRDRRRRLLRRRARGRERLHDEVHRPRLERRASERGPAPLPRCDAVRRARAGDRARDRKGNAPDWAKLLDINMLALLTERERTLDAFRTLFRSAGLRLVHAHKTKSALRILEAAAA